MTDRDFEQRMEAHKEQTKKRSNWLASLLQDSTKSIKVTIDESKIREHIAKHSV